MQRRSRKIKGGLEEEREKEEIREKGEREKEKRHEPMYE